MRRCCYLIMLFLVVSIFCSASVFAVPNELESIDSVGDVRNMSDLAIVDAYPNIDIVSAKVSDNDSCFFFSVKVDGVIENNVSVSYDFRISSLSNTSRWASVYYSDGYSALILAGAIIIECDAEVSNDTLSVIVYKDDLSYVEGPWSLVVSATIITDDEISYRDTVAIANYDPVFGIDDEIDDDIGDDEEPEDSSSTPGFLLVAIVFALAVIVLFKKVVR